VATRGHIPQKGGLLAFQSKGQGATEYLVLLAVVLIVALVSIALLGFFPSLSTDAKITQSASYWKGARPFSILSHTASVSNGNISLLIQNTDATGTSTIKAIGLNSSGYMNWTSYPAPGLAIGPGDQMGTFADADFSGTAGNVYEYQVTINYTGADGIDTIQYGGIKTLMGKYIP
jgi:hypothetical protein